MGVDIQDEGSQECKEEISGDDKGETVQDGDRREEGKEFESVLVIGMDKRRRSVAKSVTWRAIAIIITFVVAYGITGEVAYSFGISLISNFIKLGLYYIHERGWNDVTWGLCK